jgi:hypothetical protein
MSGYLPVSVDQLSQAVLTIYADGEHAPAQVWIDHFHGDHSYIRAAYPQAYCMKCEARLADLVRMLKKLYNPFADVTIVVYLEAVDPQEAAERSRLINMIP